MRSRWDQEFDDTINGLAPGAVPKRSAEVAAQHGRGKWSMAPGPIGTTPGHPDIGDPGDGVGGGWWDIGGIIDDIVDAIDGIVDDIADGIEDTGPGDTGDDPPVTDEGDGECYQLNPGREGMLACDEFDRIQEWHEAVRLCMDEGRSEEDCNEEASEMDGSSTGGDQVFDPGGSDDPCGNIWRPNC